MTNWKTTATRLHASAFADSWKQLEVKIPCSGPDLAGVEDEEEKPSTEGLASPPCPEASEALNIT